jgi:thermitase
LGLSANSRFDTRQFSILAIALLWAILLLSLTPGAKGEAAAQPKVDEDPTGAPYVAGELLVAYEPGTPQDVEQAVVRGSGGRTAEDLPRKRRLISFSGIAREKSQKAREQALQRKLEYLRNRQGVEAADYNYIRKAFWVPNDPRFDDPGQWGLKRTTFPGAWNDARGAGAKIAILDSGIDQEHSDTGNIAAQKNFFNGSSIVDDRYGHGTHVAGIAAALTNNSRGVAGGCPGCQLLVAKVMDSSGGVEDANILPAIDWSVANKADVINLSFGGSGGSAGNAVLETAINDATASGAVVVAAAGNESTNTKQYPAAYQKVIAVSATNENDKLASFSSRGSWVDLAAPGTNILSTRTGGGYNEEEGTSESAPFVSALAGLLASEGKTASEIRQRMQSTATDLGPTGDDPSFGHGRINADRAVP